MWLNIVGRAWALLNGGHLGSDKIASKLQVIEETFPGSYLPAPPPFFFAGNISTCECGLLSMLFLSICTILVNWYGGETFTFLYTL